MTRWEPETLTYQAAVIAAGSTITTTVLRHVDDFVVECKARGIWSELVEVGTFTGDSLIGALVKLKHGGVGSLTNTGFAGADYQQSQGLNGGTNKSLNTGYVLQATDGLLAFYNRTAMDNSADRTMMGTVNASSVEAVLYHTTVGVDAFSWSDIAPAGLVRANETGLYTGRRTTTTRTLALNGVVLAETSGSTTSTPETAVYLWARNNNGTAAEFWTGRGSFYAIGKTTFNDSMVLALSGAVRVLQKKLNRL